MATQYHVMTTERQYQNLGDYPYRPKSLVDRHHRLPPFILRVFHFVVLTFCVLQSYRNIPKFATESPECPCLQTNLGV